MTYEEMIQLGLQKDQKLKVILKGSVEQLNSGNVGVVAVAMVTKDVELAKNKLDEFNKNKESADYFMIYSVPLDQDLLALKHYPSLEITKEDLK